MSAETETRRFLTSETPVLAPGDAFYELSEEINNLISRRAYELFELRGSLHGFDREDWLLAESEMLQSVPVELAETEKGISISAEVPGFVERNLEVRVAPHAVCITGARAETQQRTEGDAVTVETRTRRVFRALELPAEVDPERVDATLSNGLLDINLVKMGLSKKVPVQGKAASA
jgi:HSP20 family molecular chaperone IbpA